MKLRKKAYHLSVDIGRLRKSGGQKSQFNFNTAI